MRRVFASSLYLANSAIRLLMLTTIPRLVLTLVINGVVRRVRCSDCGDDLFLGEEISTPELRDAELEQLFQEHLRARHLEVLSNPTDENI